MKRQPLLTTLLAFGIWVWLLRLYPAALVAQFTLPVPIVGMSPCAMWLLGEPVHWWKLAGAALVLAGLALNVASYRRTSLRNRAMKGRPPDRRSPPSSPRPVACATPMPAARSGELLMVDVHLPPSAERMSSPRPLTHRRCGQTSSSTRLPT